MCKEKGSGGSSELDKHLATKGHVTNEHQFFLMAALDGIDALRAFERRHPAETPVALAGTGRGATEREGTTVNVACQYCGATARLERMPPHPTWEWACPYCKGFRSGFGAEKADWLVLVMRNQIRKAREDE